MSELIQANENECYFCGDIFLDKDLTFDRILGGYICCKCSEKISEGINDLEQEMCDQCGRSLNQEDMEDVGGNDYESPERYCNECYDKLGEGQPEYNPFDTRLF